MIEVWLLLILAAAAAASVLIKAYAGLAVPKRQALLAPFATGKS